MSFNLSKIAKGSPPPNNNMFYSLKNDISDMLGQKFPGIVRRRYEPIDKLHAYDTKYKGTHSNYKAQTNPNELYTREHFAGDDSRLFWGNQKVLNTMKGFSVLASEFPLKVAPSSSPLEEVNHFDLQNDKCFYCGRDLYTGKFDKNNIHLEHLVDKAKWIKEIIRAQKHLAVYLKEVEIDPELSNNSLLHQSASVISSVIKNNAVNSLQNWMLADAECNYSKAALGYKEFISFMEQIYPHDPEDIIAENKLIYTKIKESNRVLPDQTGIITTYASKSLELTIEALGAILHEENIDLPQDEKDILFTGVGESAKESRKKIKRLLDVFDMPEYSHLKQVINFDLIKSNFKNLQSNSSKKYNEKQLIFASKEECKCPICSLKVAVDSPIQRSNGVVMFDPTINIKDFQWQLAHQDCAERCTKISLKHLKYLSELITLYRGGREKIQSAIGTDIDNVYKLFKASLDNFDSYFDKSQIQSPVLPTYNGSVGIQMLKHKRELVDSRLPSDKENYETAVVDPGQITSAKGQQFFNAPVNAGAFNLHKSTRRGDDTD